jgi:hypothetical protein
MTLPSMSSALSSSARPPISAPPTAECEAGSASRAATLHGGRLAGRVRRRSERPHRPTCPMERLKALDSVLARRGASLCSTTFLRFACELFTSTWRPRASEVAYAHLYERDRHRCQSPCCGRRDVTPHHLQFRSHGGDDSDENLTSLCTWCHLEGIHRGLMSAAPPASNIRWTFGRSSHTVVEGRRRIRR